MIGKSSTKIQDMADVGVVAPAFGDCLVFNGKAWVNASPISPLIQRQAFFRQGGSVSTFFQSQQGDLPYYAQTYIMDGYTLYFPYGVS